RFFLLRSSASFSSCNQPPLPLAWRVVAAVELSVSRCTPVRQASQPRDSFSRASAVSSFSFAAVPRSLRRPPSALRRSGFAVVARRSDLLGRSFGKLCFLVGF
ncbi:hypothetical protein Csa_022596, partial [Cucumis sativus]